MRTVALALAAATLQALFASSGNAQQPSQAPQAPRQNPFDRPSDVLAVRDAAPAEIDVAPFVLRATLTGAGAAMADIDSQILAVGEVYRGYRVIAIDEGRVVLTNNVDRLVLTVHEADAAEDRN